MTFGENACATFALQRFADPGRAGIQATFLPPASFAALGNSHRCGPKFALPCGRPRYSCLSAPGEAAALATAAGSPHQTNFTRQCTHLLAAQVNPEVDGWRWLSFFGISEIGGQASAGFSLPDRPPAVA